MSIPQCRERRSLRARPREGRRQSVRCSHSRPGCQGLHSHFGDLPGLLDMDRDRSLAVPCHDHSSLNGEASDAGKDVAAILPVAYHCAVAEDLQEGVVDIAIRAFRAANRRDGRSQWVGAAHSADLPGDRRTHDVEKRLVSYPPLDRKIGSNEVPAFRCSTSHPHAGNAFTHISGRSPPTSRGCCTCRALVRPMPAADALRSSAPVWFGQRREPFKTADLRRHRPVVNGCGGPEPVDRERGPRSA